MYLCLFVCERENDVGKYAPANVLFSAGIVCFGTQSKDGKGAATT